MKYLKIGPQLKSCYRRQNEKKMLSNDINHIIREQGISESSFVCILSRELYQNLTFMY